MTAGVERLREKTPYRHKPTEMMCNYVILEFWQNSKTFVLFWAAYGGEHMLKSERLTFTALPIHKAALECIAEAEDTSAAAIMRRLIRSEAERRGLWPDNRALKPAPRPAEVQA